MSESPWILTNSGKHFHINGDDPDEIDIRDIAHATSMQCRFTGHIDRFYSVAAHQLNVAYIIEHTLGGTTLEILEGLLHDAQEAYMSDMAKPWKNLLPDYQALEDKIEKRIRVKFNLPEAHSPLVKQADIISLFMEADEFFTDADLTQWPNYEVYQEHKNSVRLSFSHVSAAFYVQRYRKLCDG